LRLLSKGFVKVTNSLLTSVFYLQNTYFQKRARLMDEHQLDRLLVVEGERLVGIISEADIRIDEGPL